VTTKVHVHDDFCYFEVEDCGDCNDGEVVTCWDDLCANSDTCIHGDGYGPCRKCRGTGRISWCLTEADADTATLGEGTR